MNTNTLDSTMIRCLAYAMLLVASMLSGCYVEPDAAVVAPVPGEVIVEPEPVFFPPPVVVVGGGHYRR
jgi:hypothetical protein